MKGLLYVAIFQGVNQSFHVQTTWLVFHSVKLLEIYSALFWEILQKLAELHSSSDVPLTPTDSILYSGHTSEDGLSQITTIENESFNWMKMVSCKLMRIGNNYNWKLGLLSKWAFSHLSTWKPHKCVLECSEQGLIFWDNWLEWSHA